MKKFKTMLQRAWHAGGEALHQKPTRSLVALILCCAGVAYALAPAKDAATDRPNNPSLVDSKAEGVTQNTEAIAAFEKDLSDRMNRLEERERQLYAQSLEASRKSIDWWFGGLAILTTLVAFLGAFLPWLMGRKDKELLQSELQNARDLVSDIKGHEKSAQQAVAKIEEDKLKVASFQSGHEQSPANKKHTRDAAQKVNAEPSSSDSEKLRARAVLASQKDKPTAEEANAAYELWFALTVLKPDDASAHFNAGYWAQQLFDSSDTKDRSRWLAVLQKHYQQRLELKKDGHDAAYNWGRALANEAHAIQEIEAGQAQSLLQKAQTLLEYHRDASAQAATKVAYNLACVYAVQGKALACVQQLEVSRSASVLPDRRHLEKDKDLDAVRESPEFQAWWVKHFPD